MSTYHKNKEQRIKEFGSEKGYLGPDKISAVDCGYIFEDLVRRFSESFGEEAGAHFTSRDIIYLMTDLLLSEADLDTSSMAVYDMAMGSRSISFPPLYFYSLISCFYYTLIR